VPAACRLPSAGVRSSYEERLSSRFRPLQRFE